MQPEQVQPVLPERLVPGLASPELQPEHFVPEQVLRASELGQPGPERELLALVQVLPEPERLEQVLPVLQSSPDLASAGTSIPALQEASEHPCERPDLS